MKRAFCLAIACVIVWLTTGALIASTSVGVFAIVDEVTFEPTDKAPERVRISGMFVVPVPVSSGLHKAPQRGYLYFNLIPGKEQAVRKDWADLKAVAGTGRVVGFGQYWITKPATGAIHWSLEVQVHDKEDVALPEPYAVPNEKGIVKTFDSEADTRPRFGEASSTIIERLREAYRH
jgi:hypothetical protein